MLTKEIESALNGQIESEAYASSTYLAMASWCETEGLRGCAGFFYAQSAEERVHMLKLVRYINGSNGHAVIPAVKKPAAAYKSVNDVFECSLKHEQGVSQKIHELVAMTFAAKDFASHNFLQWYVAEQIEEENLFNSVLDMIRIAGKGEQALFLIDKEIGQLRKEAAQETAAEGA